MIRVMLILHWILAVVTAEALVYVLFLLVVSGGQRHCVIQSVGRSTLVARQYVQTAVQGEVARGAQPAAALKTALASLALISDDKAWVAGPAGEIVAASFSGKVSPPVTDPKRTGHFREAAVSADAGPRGEAYTVVPLTLEKRSMTLHLLSQPQAEVIPRGVFAGGLALIAGLLSLLAWPVSLRLTMPLERLEDSALRIAGGDLSARAEITGEHMIGKQLGNAFNIMAETVERMIRGGKELTANISHELRSPLARIRIAGECLNEALDRGNKADAKEMLQAMWEDIDEADRMIGRILEFSKVDLHEPLQMSEEVAPAEIIEGLARTLTPFARSKQIEIRLDLDTGIRVAGSAEWLRAAFKNLLENAVRYTEPGGSVQAALRGDAGEMLLEVTNSHAPFDPEELELIFKPFYRGQTTSGDGTGLGLAIVQKIVGMHHGEVGARNVTEGFQVWVRLPGKMT